MYPHPQLHPRDKPGTHPRLAIATALLLAGPVSLAHDGVKHDDGIHSNPAETVQAPFDNVHTKISNEGNIATSHIAVAGTAGDRKPAKTGKHAGRTEEHT